MIQFSHFNWFDYFLVVIIFLSLLYGLRRGFLREIISSVSWLAAFFVAIMFASDLQKYFGKRREQTSRQWKVEWNHHGNLRE